jgi:hypothetical protein
MADSPRCVDGVTIITVLMGRHRCQVDVVAAVDGAVCVTRRLACRLELQIEATPSLKQVFLKQDLNGFSEMRSFQDVSKQRQVNLQTKSSLRLPTSCTELYIRQDKTFNA